MKFDKIMEIGFRILAGFTALLCIVGFVASCSPLRAVALDSTDVIPDTIKYYGDRALYDLDQIEQSIASDVNDGTLDTTTQLYQDTLKVATAQNLFFNSPQFRTLYDVANLGIQEYDKFLEYLNNNPTTTYSGYGTSGFYRLSYGGDLRYCTITTFPDWSRSNFGNIFIFADDYSYYLECDNPSVAECRCYNDNYDGNHPYEFQIRCRATNMGPRTHVNVVGSGIGSTWSNWMSWGNGSGNSERSITFRGSNKEAWLIPVYSSINPQYGFPDPLFACGVNVTLPEDTVDTSEPWDYYNNTLLPELKTNFPDVPDNYYVFYDGYTPDIPEPTEPQTYPNGGINIGSNNNIDIDFNIIIATDSNGQPLTEWVTNESGETIATETITETVYVTENRPDSAKYNVHMPTFEEIKMEDATLPPMDISSFGDGIGFIWNACYHILTDSGFMPVVMACIGISICTFVIWKLGG